MTWAAPLAIPPPRSVLAMNEAERELRRKQWRESQQRVRGKRPALSAGYVRRVRLKNLRATSK